MNKLFPELLDIMIIIHFLQVTATFLKKIEIEEKSRDK